MPAALFEKARSAAQFLGEVAGELEGGVLDVEGAKVLVDVLDAGVNGSRWQGAVSRRGGWRPR